VDLPGAGPVLHDFLTLDRVADVGEVLVPDEALEAVLPGEAIDQTLPVLPCATGEIARHAAIERAVAPVGHEVNPAALLHGPMLRSCVSPATVMPGLVPGIHVFPVTALILRRSRSDRLEGGSRDH
jgi:hypothetical protein